MITPTNYLDPDLADIRDMLEGKDTDVPVLLMPVRIETRFMTTDKVILSDSVINALIDQLLWLDFRLKFNPTVWSAPTLISSLADIQLRLDAISDLIDEIEDVSPKESSWILDIHTNLQTRVDRFTKLLNKTVKLHPSEAREIRAAIRKFKASTRVIMKALPEIEINNESRYKDTANMIDLLNKVEDTLQDMSTYDMTATDRKMKRVVFAWVEGRFSKIDSLLAEVSKVHSINMVATITQIDRIKELGTTINSLPTAIRKNLDTLNSDFKKVEYKARLDALVNNGMARMNRQITDELLPKLELYHHLKTFSGREVAYQANKIRYHLKWINSRPAFRTYNQIKTQRLQLYKMMHDLRADIHKVIEIGSSDMQFINEAWDEADAELAKFVDRVSQFKGADKGQRIGVSRTQTHINKEYRRDLQGLKTGAKTVMPALTGQKLTQSINTYTGAMKRMNALRKRLADAKKGSAALKKKVLEEVKTAAREFNVKSRSIRIIPDENFQALNKVSNTIVNSTNAVVKQLGNSGATADLRKEAVAAAASIQGNVSNQITDVLDQADWFYDEERAPLIFSLKTETVHELWVRIYPDDIAVHTHEELLTEDEVAAGQAYWIEIWAAEDDEDLKLGAWRALVASYGSQRAAWIAKSLTPDNEEEIAALKAWAATPSLHIRAAITEMTSASGILEEVKSEMVPYDAFGVDLGAVKTHLTTARDEATGIAKDHNTLVTKAKRLMAKMQRKLRLLNRYRTALTAAETSMLTTALIDLGDSMTLFNELATIINGIVPINARMILADLEENPHFDDIETKSDSWTVAPHTRVMPDRFVAITMQGDEFRHIKVGEPLKEGFLQVGMDPETFDSEIYAYDDEGNLIVDENIKWMTDYNQAVADGMAISIPLTEDELEETYDRIIVLGVKDSTEAEGANLLEDLIDNHHYVHEGASFMPIGTPTNNTEDGESGYKSVEEDEELSFLVERNNENEYISAEDADFPSDGKRTADALGISSDVFINLYNHDLTEISEAMNMNRLLYPATLGNFMEEMLDQMFTVDNINRTGEFMKNYVSGRGVLPTLRVGTQPYGILPTMAFRNFTGNSEELGLPELSEEDFEDTSAIEDDLQLRFDIRLWDLIQAMESYWTTIREDDVKHLHTDGVDDPQQHFMSMLGLHAVSVENHYRYGLNIASRRAGEEFDGVEINFEDDDVYSPYQLNEAFKELVYDGYYFESDYFYDETGEYTDPTLQASDRYNRISDQFDEMRVYLTRHLAEQAQLTGDVIDNRELLEAFEESTEEGTLSEIIDWVLDTRPYELLANNELENMPSNSLMFLLLRHAMLLSYMDAGLRILEHEGLTDQKTRKKMGQADYYHTYDPTGGYTYATKWTWLFKSFPDLNGLLNFDMDEGNRLYRHLSSSYLSSYVDLTDTGFYDSYSHHSDHDHIMADVIEYREGLARLKSIATKKLDRLMSEHLDLCTYRLDAWKLGFANKRLEEMRTAKPEGIYLGAFGYVEDLSKGGDRDEAETIPDGLWKEGDDPIYTDADNQGSILAPSLNHAIGAAILRAAYTSNNETSDVENQFAVNLSSERVRMAISLMEGIRGGQEVGAVLGYQFERALHERYLHLEEYELDQHIYTFRELYPLTPSVDSENSFGDYAQNSVVNGLDLLEDAQTMMDNLGDGVLAPDDGILQALLDHEDDFWNNYVGYTEWETTWPDSGMREIFYKEIDRMGNAFDALGDLALTESVYQVARGNHVRASALLDALSKGDIPPDAQVINTPRTGVVVTHKVNLFLEPISGIDQELATEDAVPLADAELDAALSDASAIPTDWPASHSPRAIAEPSVNKWLGTMFGNPTDIRILVEYTVDEVEQTDTISLHDLDVQPVDVLHIFSSDAASMSTELQARIGYYVRKNMTAPTDGTTSDDVVLDMRYTERDEDGWGDEVKSFYEFSSLVTCMKEMIGNSGVVAADDLLIAGDEELEPDAIRQQDKDEIHLRVTNLRGRMEVLHDAFSSYFTDEVDPENMDDVVFTEDQVNDLRALLLQAADFGIKRGVPPTAVDYSYDTGVSLVERATSIQDTLASRLEKADENIALAEEAGVANDTAIAYLTEACKNICGKSYVIVPQFTLRNPDDLSDQANLADVDGLLRSAADFSMETWLQSMSTVRPRMNALSDCEMFTEAFDVDFPDFYPIQFQSGAEEGSDLGHWVGIEFPDDYAPEDHFLSLVNMNVAQLQSDTEANKVALLVDEWVEMIPNKDETVGVTFNYDQPDAKPANTMLLALSPSQDQGWDWDNLVYTILDTIDLAKNRAVEPEQLDESIFSQVLPAIMAEVVPPQLVDEDDPELDNPLGLQVVTDFGDNNLEFPVVEDDETE